MRLHSTPHAGSLCACLQVHDTLDTLRKQRTKAKITEQACIVVAGDFNSQGHSAVRELLEGGEVVPAFRESGDPTEIDQQTAEVTSKAKRQELGTFTDVMLAAYSAPADAEVLQSSAPSVPLDAASVEAIARFEAWRQIGRPISSREPESASPDPPGAGDGAAVQKATGADALPTLVAAELMSLMVDSAGQPTAELVAAVDECFGALSADGETLTEEEHEAWLVRINGVVGRGSEYRSALACREAHEGTALTRSDFRSIYAEELAQGKFWGVEHDLRALRGRGMRQPGAAPFTARFDQMYFSNATLRLVAAQEALPPERLSSLLSGREILPNEWHPSDHLPVAAAIEFSAP
jgi:hypothetical protein